VPWRLVGLTTRGRCLLAAGLAVALCAVLVDERDLLRVAAFAMMLPLLASVVVGYRQARLRGTRDLVPSRIAVGGDCQAHLTLHGTGRLGGRLLVEDVVPPALGGSCRAVVARLPRLGTIELSYPIRPVQRRVHSVGPLIVRTVRWVPGTRQAVGWASARARTRWWYAVTAKVTTYARCTGARRPGETS
jgi:uncharacterized protein (DUF58 family)